MKITIKNFVRKDCSLPHQSYHCLNTVSRWLILIKQHPVSLFLVSSVFLSRQPSSPYFFSLSGQRLCYILYCQLHEQSDHLSFRTGSLENECDSPCLLSLLSELLVQVIWFTTVRKII